MSAMKVPSREEWALQRCLPGNLAVVAAEEDMRLLAVPTGEAGTVPVCLDRWTLAAVMGDGRTAEVLPGGYCFSGADLSLS